jgi:hypothetical protein
VGEGQKIMKTREQPGGYPFSRQNRPVYQSLQAKIFESRNKAMPLLSTFSLE